MKTAISMPNPLFEAAEREAHRLGVSRSELFQRAVQAFLQGHREDGITEALNQVYGSRRGESQLHADIGRLQAASLPPTEKW